LIDVRHPLSRREFLRAAGLAGAGVALLGACGSDDSNGGPTGTPGAVVDQPPETTRLRLPIGTSICLAPQYLAEEFLPAEGFTDVQYIELPGSAAIAKTLASGEADISLYFAASAAIGIDAGDPVLLLAGAHVGCWEVFGTDRVQSIRDLRGKTVAVNEVAPTAFDYAFMVSTLTFVGIDPVKDVNFEAHKKDEAIQLLAEGKVDAYLAFPPTNLQLRAQNIGHVVLNSMMDPPWLQYFCCMATGNRDFVEQHPAATKRALRAILKGADVCAQEPERAARFLVDRGYADNYEYALETMKMTPYNVWREFNPEDTLRFYSLRLKEAGIIKKTPAEIIRQGTDWRFLEEIKRELGATSTRSGESLWCSVNATV
jgi:NitT/TauT family transport system substrate-binding protein